MDTKVSDNETEVLHAKVTEGTYTKECREQAVKWVLEEGLSLRGAGQRLSLSPKTLQNWVIAARKGTLKAVGTAQRPFRDRTGTGAGEA